MRSTGRVRTSSCHRRGNERDSAIGVAMIMVPLVCVCRVAVVWSLPISLVEVEFYLYVPLSHREGLHGPMTFAAPRRDLRVLEFERER